MKTMKNTFNGCRNQDGRLNMQIKTNEHFLKMVKGNALSLTSTVSVLSMKEKWIAISQSLL